MNAGGTFFWGVGGPSSAGTGGLQLGHGLVGGHSPLWTPMCNRRARGAYSSLWQEASGQVIRAQTLGTKPVPGPQGGYSQYGAAVGFSAHPTAFLQQQQQQQQQQQVGVAFFIRERFLMNERAGG
jgi:hypothetical protein